MTQSKSTSLVIKDLTVELAGRRLLDNLDLTLHPGEILGVSGASGSGKTLLAWTILGLQPDAASITGSIELRSNHANVDLRDKHTQLKSRGSHVALIPQNPYSSLNPSIRCGSQIVETLHHQTPKIHKELTLDLLRQLGFDDPDRIFQAYPHQLSGGQLQRVVIAMAVINKPNVLIADEPATALDARNKQKILELICTWANNNSASVMIVSHDLALINAYCSRVVALSNGRLAESQVQSRRQESVNTKISHWTPEEVVLSLHNVTKTYRSSSGEVPTLADFSMTIRRGESSGLIGESGSGKSTLARLICGLDLPDKGDMLFKSNRIDYRTTPGLRKKIQIVFQDPYSALYPHKTAGYCVKEALDLHAESSAESLKTSLVELFELVGLSPDHIDRSTQTLSGGERQRVQIARALAVNPELLICDECTSGLDAEIQERILTLLSQLKSTLNLTVLFISHDLKAVIKVCDTVSILSEGAIIESGPVQQILTQPQFASTKAFISGLN